MLHRRLGFFEIGRDLILGDTEIIIKAFQELGVLPIRVEDRFERNTMKYMAICPEFEEIDLGQMCPNYKLIIDLDDEGEFDDAYFLKE